ncbi:MFS transporter [Ornithinimicrobium sp. F0845]|uniref:MFS transporter n=1 Tax=Ornithinimicrobium sp. F0845 TaxID=2926412 RepID=UPI001FF4A000|nr:MFS transporter [Ornithinimicrobium sp. F0845]MCK0111745.1 MFS transporter [Ornithinimicrobium sp. F0845]
MSDRRPDPVGSSPVDDDRTRPVEPPPGAVRRETWDSPEARAEQERWRENHPLEGGQTYGPIAGASARPKPSPAAKVAQAGVTVGHGLSRSAKAVAHGTNVVGHSAYRVTRRATHAGGAGESGLSRLIEIHGLHNAGDAVVAISLAGTLFFSVPTGEARGQVALFLLLTLLPFSIIAPFVGPFLDRFRQGRRWAIGSTMAIRAVLCLVLASSLDTSAWWQFPMALGILVASKAYNVTRSAATPRLLPEGMTLVKANGRMSLAGTLGATLAAPVGVGLAYFGAEWSLRFAFLIFAVGTVLAILLSPRVDSAKGETEVPIGEVAGRSSRWVPAPVVTALRANVGLRMLSGFLTIFLAFLLRESPPEGWGGVDNYPLLLGVVVAAAGAGSALGTLLGSLTKMLPPRALVRITLIVDVVAAVITAFNFGMVTVVMLSLVVGLCQQVGKLALDAVIQETVPEHMRTSVFARSETLIQLSWVIGGGLAVALPTDATIGMTVIAVVLVAWLLVVLLPGRKGSRLTAERAPSA